MASAADRVRGEEVGERPEKGYGLALAQDAKSMSNVEPELWNKNG